MVPASKMQLKLILLDYIRVFFIGVNIVNFN